MLVCASAGSTNEDCNERCSEQKMEEFLRRWHGDCMGFDGERRELALQDEIAWEWKRYELRTWR